MKNKHVISYILIFAVSFGGTYLLINGFVKYSNHKAEEYIRNFNPSQVTIQDGEYQGKFKVFAITVSSVKLTISEGKVSGIEFRRMMQSPGTSYKQDIEQSYLNNKNLDLDAITGATRTSNFAKAAIKNALENNTLKR